MPNNTEISTTLRAWCPACGNLYVGPSLLFLYADERGFCCLDCGRVLMVGDGGHQGKPLSSHRLVIAEGLEGSELHRRLVELVEDEEGMRVLVDRMGEARAVCLKT